LNLPSFIPAIENSLPLGKCFTGRRDVLLAHAHTWSRQAMEVPLALQNVLREPETQQEKEKGVLPSL